MKKILCKSSLVVFVMTLLLFGSTDGLAQRKPVIKRKPVTRRAVVPAEKLYTVLAGTTMRVRLNSQLSSKVNQVGDTFSVTATEPVYSTTGVIVIPTGSTLTGKVVAVTPAKKGGNVGSIDCSFVTVNLPNGRKKTINGSLSELDTNTAKSDNEGTAKGDRTNHRKVKFIGGGGVGGAVLGGVIGGGKGALIGGIIGGVGGLIAERQTKGEEATVKSGTEFGVYLNQSVSLPRFTEEADSPASNGTEYPPSAGDRTYTVQPGDTLSKISLRFYGTTSRYMDIYEANRDQLSSPASVSVGQELRIP
jgi:LysM repeat protein